MFARIAWITGAHGLIGNYLVHEARAHSPQTHIIGLTRRELDLSNFAAVHSAFHEQKPELVIHCAALTNTAACQANPALTHQLNVEVTRVLIELAADIPFVFISTD